jgi:hypothetical protein
MSGRFLACYLAITGVAAIFSLTHPDAVFFLHYVGVGLILALTPTAFLWGCIFALGYGLARVVARPAFATTAALVVTALAVWAIPQPSVHDAKAALARFQLPNVTPPDLIRLQGDVRIATPGTYPGEPDRERPGLPTYRCDARCIAILFEPGVRSVTMTHARTPTFEFARDELSQPDSDSRTYRLVPKAECGDRGIALDSQRINTRFGNTEADRRAVAAEWSTKLATDYCLTGEAPLDRYDIVLRTGSWQYRVPDWSIDTAIVQGEFSDIRNSNGEVLFRRFDLVTAPLSVPLMIFMRGDTQNLRFGWARSTLESKLGEIDKALDAAIAVKRSAAIGDSIVNARSAIRAAFLDSPTATAQSGSLVIRNYMEMLGRAESEDVALVETLLRDPRLDDLPGAWKLYQSFSPEQLNGLLPAIISKLGMETSKEPTRENDLGRDLEYWPKSAFANPDQATLALLANPLLNIRANGLVARLSDMGERGAPLAADVIEQHMYAATSNPRSIAAELRAFTAIAGVRAMCRLGAQAASQLPRMRELETKFVVRGSRLGSWDTMMMRIGKPLTDFKGRDGSTLTEQELIGLKYRFEHLDADRDCRN